VTTATRLWTAANVAMFVLFAFAVVVQFNDPDPGIWMTIYGLAACACLLAITGRARWWLTSMVGAAALAWAVTIEPRVLGKVPFGEMFSAWEMKDTGVEESREMYGLLIVAVWMGVLTVRSVRARTSAKGA
jgi:hypothetical protein